MNIKFNFMIICLIMNLAYSDLFAESTNSYITIDKSKGVFTLAEGGKSAPIYASSQDFPGVHRVIKHLQRDISSVTNAQSEIKLDTKLFGEQVIIIGTLGKNPLIDELVKNKKDQMLLDLFPGVALKFFENREKQNENPKTQAYNCLNDK